MMISLLKIIELKRNGFGEPYFLDKQTIPELLSFFGKLAGTPTKCGENHMTNQGFLFIFPSNSAPRQGQSADLFVIGILAPQRLTQVLDRPCGHWGRILFEKLQQQQQQNVADYILSVQMYQVIAGLCIPVLSCSIPGEALSTSDGKVVSCH